MYKPQYLAYCLISRYAATMLHVTLSILVPVDYQKKKKKITALYDGDTPFSLSLSQDHTIHT